MNSVPGYCLCRKPYDENHFMIECNRCQDWFHGSCVDVEEEKAADIDIYHCPDCEVSHGPSIMKNFHESSNVGETLKREPVLTGSPEFIHQLQGKTFDSADEVVLKPTGSQLTVEFLEKSSFSVPILVLKREGLGMTLPPPSFTIRDVEQYVGSDKEIDVMDAACQARCKMMLGDFVKYYYSEKRENIFNVVSLEFSNTRLSKIVEVPKIVSKLSWIENLWPEECEFERPKVQKYCFMSVQDSYTDFHVEFGGTSVWYHVLKGEKVFYLIHPEDANLTLFECWRNSSKQREMFFGDQVDKCYKCSVEQGQTLFIPPGWIHAVLTPMDCLAFGGNFLHSLSIEMQLKAYETVKQLSTADLFKFPSFETICWHVGKQILDILGGLRENGRHPASYLVRGGKALNMAFQAWTRKEVLEDHQHAIPKTVQTIQLIEDLATEICLVEDTSQQNIQKANTIFGVEQLFPTISSSLTWPTDSPSVSKPTLSSPSKSDSKKDPELKDVFKKTNPKDKEHQVLGSDDQGMDNLRGLDNHQVLKAGSSQKVEFSIANSCLNDSGNDSKSDNVYDGNESPMALLMANGGTSRVKSLSNSWRAKIITKEDNSMLVKEQVMGDKFDLGSNVELQIEERLGKQKMSLVVIPNIPPNFPHVKFCSGQNQIHKQEESVITTENCKINKEIVEGVEDKIWNGSGSGRIIDPFKAREQMDRLDSVVLTEDPDFFDNKEAIQDIVTIPELQSSSPSPAPCSLQTWWSERQDQSIESFSSDLGMVPKSLVSQHTQRKWPIKRLVYWRTKSVEENNRVNKQDSLGTCLKDAEHAYLFLESDDEDDNDDNDDDDDDDDDGGGGGGGSGDSDGDDDLVLRSLPKKRRISNDAPWIPSSRVIPPLPKQDRPVRKGTRVASTEVGLPAAATKLAQQEFLLG
ncbi:histone lysine demethylase PHF8-like [Mesocricetus auratus]|uniref:Histone lysine demethylase PHF8-like n=1 Tax=Mesocricetus auratus TaxID=10036 RepID=A0A3Q0D8T5_MESAU|nr:histone lysine demethylase PHF8-like [Mesocricetus auratus]